MPAVPGRSARRARRLRSFLAVLGIAVARDAAGADLLLKNARLFDGTGPSAQADVDVLIRGGRIAAIGPSIAVSDEVTRLDVARATALPGLIDGHVHNAVVPGSAYRRDPPEIKDALRRQHLRGYLAAGVTTVLDTAISATLARELASWLAAGHAGPNLYTLGPPLAAPGGYGSSTSPETTVSRPEDLDAAFDLIEATGAIGVKVLLETGFGPGEGTLPTHSAEMRAAIAHAAARRNLPIYTHGSSEAEQRMGLEMGAHVLVHLDSYAGPLSDAFLREARARGAFVMTTFSIMDAELTRWRPQRLDDPLVALVVPARERATAHEPAAGAFEAAAQIEIAAPWLPRILHPLAAWAFVSEAGYEKLLANSVFAARQLHEVGVPLVVGSDAGNWDVQVYQFHAASTHRELELLAEAGLTPVEVIAAATRIPARMLGLAGEVGTIEVGCRADLIVVDGDPLTDVRALRSIRWTVKDGIARTPSEWMSSE